jgi:hypothetical protein
MRKIFVPAEVSKKFIKGSPKDPDLARAAAERGAAEPQVAGKPGDSMGTWNVA